MGEGDTYSREVKGGGEGYLLKEGGNYSKEGGNYSQGRAVIILKGGGNYPREGGGIYSRGGGIQGGKGYLC